MTEHENATPVEPVEPDTGLIPGQPAPDIADPDAEPQPGETPPADEPDDDDADDR